MRYSVRDHKAVVHSVNYIADPYGACWVPAMEAKELARRTHRVFLAHTMCAVRVKIHHRTANRISDEAHTCLLCIKENHDVETA